MNADIWCSTCGTIIVDPPNISLEQIKYDGIYCESCEQWWDKNKLQPEDIK